MACAQSCGSEAVELIALAFTCHPRPPCQPPFTCSVPSPPVTRVNSTECLDGSCVATSNMLTNLNTAGASERCCGCPSTICSASSVASFRRQAWSQSWRYVRGGGAAYRGGAPALRAPHVEDCASGRLHGSQKWKFDLIVVKTGRQRRREPLGVWRQKGVSPRPAAVHCAYAVASCVRKGCILCADACDTQVPACGCRHAGRCSPPTHRRSNFRNSSCP